MNESEKLSSELHDIKQMMERSSRFISLSGLSGISAGICALAGAWFSADVIERNKSAIHNLKISIAGADSMMYGDFVHSRLFQIALVTSVQHLYPLFFLLIGAAKKLMCRYGEQLQED